MPLVETSQAEGSNATETLNVTVVKILYSPDTPTTRRIIDRANRTFAIVDTILHLADQVDTCSQYFLQHFPQNETSATLLRDSLLQTPSLAGNYSDLLYLFEPKRPQNIWEQIELASEIAQDTQQVLATIDWDFFLPVASSLQMEQLAANISQQKEKGISIVFAGVTFPDDIEQQQHPLKNVTISIRMNSTFVHETDILRES